MNQTTMPDYMKDYMSDVYDTIYVAKWCLMFARVHNSLIDYDYDWWCIHTVLESFIDRISKLYETEDEENLFSEILEAVFGCIVQDSLGGNH